MSKAQNDEPCAFAKLWGQLDGLPFHCYMTSLPSTLGRGSLATQGSRKPPGFIDLGQSKALSREHATISWVPERKTYQITCLSKNGMIVSGCYHAKGGVDNLESRTPIKLGPASMYFLLPEKVSQQPPAPAPAPATILSVPHHSAPIPGQPRASKGALKATPAPVVATAADSFEGMIRGAFRSPALAATAGAAGLSSGDVHNWIMQNYPEWNQEGARMRTLATGIDSALKKSFKSSGGDRWTDPTLVPSAKRLKLANDAPPAQGAAASVSSQWAANMTGSGDSGRQVNGGGVASAVDNRAGMGEDDGGGIDVGMDG